jgi:hypothetical protein
MYIMNSIYLTPVAYGALLFGCAIANAQSAATPPSDRSDAAPLSNHVDTAMGNNLVRTTAADDVSTPASSGQDKSTGNDLVSPKGDADRSGVKQASAARPDFNTLDTKKKGALTSDDVKSNKWLRKNFARCDSDHDGTMSREEYIACK